MLGVAALNLATFGAKQPGSGNSPGLAPDLAVTCIKFGNAVDFCLTSMRIGGQEFSRAVSGAGPPGTAMEGLDLYPSACSSLHRAKVKLRISGW